MCVRLCAHVHGSTGVHASVVHVCMCKWAQVCVHLSACGHRCVCAHIPSPASCDLPLPSGGRACPEPCLTQGGNHAAGDVSLGGVRKPRAVGPRGRMEGWRGVSGFGRDRWRARLPLIWGSAGPPRPLVVSTLWVLWGDPRVALGQRRSTQRPVPFWRESLVSLIPRLKMHFHAAEWWGAGSGLGG